MKTRTVYDLAMELDGINTQIHTLGYSVLDGVSKDLSYTTESLANVLFTISNHIDRIVSDMEQID